MMPWSTGCLGSASAWSGELLLDLELFGDGLLGVVDDIQKQDRADECRLVARGPRGRVTRVRWRLGHAPDEHAASEQLLHLYRPAWDSANSGNRVRFPDFHAFGDPARCAAFLSSSIMRLHPTAGHARINHADFQQEPRPTVEKLTISQTRPVQTDTRPGETHDTLCVRPG